MNHLSRISSAVIAATVFVAVSPSQAQDYPTKPIRIIVPFPGGSGPDVDTRGVAAELSKVLGQPVVVENRPGASGTIGLEAGIQAAPDGYTLVVGTPTTLFLMPRLSSKVTYNVDRDLAPVSLMGYLNTALLANAALPQADVAEIIAQAKRLPGSINVATLGVGTSSHIAGEWFARESGIKLNFVPYNTSSPFSDLLAGQVQLLFDALPAAIGNVRAGKLKIIALTGKLRHPNFPDTPTFAEAGFADYNPIAFISLFAPAGTPKPIIEKLAAGVQKAVTMNPALIDKWRSNGGELKATTPDEFAAFLKVESAKSAQAISRANVRLD